MLGIKIFYMSNIIVDFFTFKSYVEFSCVVPTIGI